MKTAILFNQQRMQVDDADSLSILKNGIFEPIETNSVLALVKPRDRVLDIGANIGYYTVLVAEQIGPLGEVFAIEPNAANLRILKANTLALNHSSCVTILPYALSDAKGAGSLFLSSHNPGMHRMYASILCSDVVEKVNIVCGDDLNLGALDFIKIDIEGYEAKALRGLVNTLKNSPNVKILSEFSPLCLMEAGDSPSEFIKWMSDHGFVVLGLKDNKWCFNSTESLLASLRVLESIHLKSLVDSLSGLDFSMILERAINLANQCGYDRPIDEYFLFVRPDCVASIEKLEFRQTSS